MAKIRNGKITSNSLVGKIMIHRTENGKIIRISHSWHPEDIEDRIREKGRIPTLQLVDDVLESLDRGFDASNGINWNVIDTHIDMCLTS